MVLVGGVDEAGAPVAQVLISSDGVTWAKEDIVLGHQGSLGARGWPAATSDDYQIVIAGGVRPAQVITPFSFCAFLFAHVCTCTYCRRLCAWTKP